MTIHALTKPGSRQTVCDLTVPGIIRVGANAVTWNDGDGSITGLCTDGCYAKLNEVVPAPSSPRPAALQRFNVVAEMGSDKLTIGSAITNRDQSISLHLRTVPMGGAKLRLVPA